MNDKAELSLLLDYYGSFLTERQRELMRMSADEDMSLSEIAEQVGISRQAVRDSLSKASDQLHFMESELGLALHDTRLRHICGVLNSAKERVSDPEALALMDEALAGIDSLIR